MCLLMLDLVMIVLLRFMRLDIFKVIMTCLCLLLVLNNLQVLCFLFLMRLNDLFLVLGKLMASVLLVASLNGGSGLSRVYGAPLMEWRRNNEEW